MKPLSLAEQFIIMDPRLRAHPRPVTETFYQDLGRDFGDFQGHNLISCYRFTEDWKNWECHPAGDELVCLMSGKATLVLQTEQGEHCLELMHSGDTAIVPRGIWHTARVNRECMMLFITPGEGTLNAGQPGESEAD